jgi:hypothetical protein
MLQAGSNQQKTIELTDDVLETGEVITNLFDIMIQDKNILDVPLTSATLTECRRAVVLFAQKYDFTTELRLITYQLQAALSNFNDMKRDPRPIFNIGLMLDRHELCRDALKTAGTGWNRMQGCEPGQEKEFGQGVKGGRIFDVAGGPLTGLKEMPVEIIWALLRAAYQPSNLAGAQLQAEYDKIAKNYARLMALPGESFSKTSFNR